MTLSAMLLAGGESRRMGIDKAQLVFEGEPLWLRQIQLLRQFAPKELFISRRNDPDWCPPNVTLVLDEPPSRGPMSGICATLLRMSTSHLLVLAVDMPFLLKDDLQHLVRHVRAGCGVIPLTNQRAEPLAAIYPKELSVYFAAALSGEDSSVQKLVTRLFEVGRLDPVHLSQAEAQRYRSVNTREDLVAPEGRASARPKLEASNEYGEVRKHVPPT